MYTKGNKLSTETLNIIFIVIISILIIIIVVFVIIIIIVVLLFVVVENVKTSKKQWNRPSIKAQ